MLFSEILRQLDAELERVKAIRTVIAGLAEPLPIEKHLHQFAGSAELTKPGMLDTVAAAAAKMATQDAAQAGAPSPTEAVPVTKLPPSRRARQPYQARVKVQAKSEPRALTSTVPTGPVIISPQALAREREQRAGKAAQEVQEAAAAVSPSSLAQALAARWLTPGQSA